MICLIGAGGHGRVVLDAILAGDAMATVRVRDGNQAASRNTLLGHPIVWPEFEDDMAGRSAHVAVGSAVVRARLCDALVARGAVLLTVIHPAAIVSPYAKIGPGSFIAAGAVVGPQAELGQGVIVNHGAIVDHDCRVGDYAHIAPSAVLGGGASVGARGLAGAGSVLLAGLRLGADTTLGAGAVALEDVPDGAVWVGIPARPKGRVHV